MSELPRVSGKDLCAALERHGYRFSHQRGSHVYLRAPTDLRLVIVPVHGNRDLPLGTLRSILRQAGLTADQLREILGD